MNPNGPVIACPEGSRREDGHFDDDAGLDRAEQVVRFRGLGAVPVTCFSGIEAFSVLGEDRKFSANGCWDCSSPAKGVCRGQGPTRDCTKGETSFPHCTCDAVNLKLCCCDQ